MNTITKDQIKQLRELVCDLNAEIERENNHPLRSIVVGCYFDDEDEPLCAMYVTAWPTRSADDETRVLYALYAAENLVNKLGINCSIALNSSPDCHTAVWNVKN